MAFVNDYPLPIYAGAIWIADDVIWLAIPGENKSHAVHFPNNEFGMKSIVRVLNDLALHTAPPKILDPGAPTQWDVDKNIERLKGRIKKIPPTSRKISDNITTADLLEGFLDD